MSRQGKAQALTDQDSTSSERITGCDLLTSVVETSVLTGDIVFNPEGDFFGTSEAHYTPLTPSTISARLGAIEEIYQWYAIRDLKIRYIPNCGSDTTGSVALGITTDPTAITLGNIPAAPSQQQVLELNPALLAPVWGSSIMEMKFRGTKLFACDALGGQSVATLDQGIQCALAVSGTSLTSATKLGQIWVDYTIDFYQQTPILSAVDLFRSGRPCPRCYQPVPCDPRQRKPALRLERKSDRKTGDYVIIRAQEPPSVELRPLPALATRGTSDLFRDERETPISSKRAQSFKG
jgi:hypothetical protein